MGLRSVVAYTDPIEANILKARLAAEGIDAFVFDEHLIRMNWLYSNALGGAKVMVPEEQVGAAEAVIRAIAAGEYELDATEGQEGTGLRTSCPYCGAVSTRLSNRSWTVSFLSFFLLQIPLPFRRNRWKCDRCGRVSAR